jgi:quercetin dioxygenase-like cupin family protein
VHFIIALLQGSNEPQRNREEIKMFTTKANRKWIRSTAAAAVIAVVTFAASAQAGECPAGKSMPNARQAVDVKGGGVTDTTLGSINLGTQPAKITGRELRFRKLTIVPGGIVPWHSHDDRPALIFIAEGEIFEYASNCAVPIVHKAGELRAEKYGTSHWWKNLGKKTVVLYVGDVRRDPNDHNM